MNLLDPNLDMKHDEVQMRRMVLAASLCITRAARLRPQTSRVIYTYQKGSLCSLHHAKLIMLGPSNLQILSLLQGEEDIDAWMNCHTDTTLNELDCQDEETYPASSIGSHLGLALLDVEDDASVTSFEQSQLGSLEEYLRERWSRSSSFD